MYRLRTLVAAALGVGLLAATVIPTAQADDDADFAAYDLDQAARTTERQGFHYETAEYGIASFGAFGESFLQGVARQQGDLSEGRVYGGAGQALPGGNVGDPQRYEEFEARSHTVEFANREGTNLVGRFWPCNSTVSPSPSTGPCPLVVVTTGSIQVTQLMYGWLASHLQDHGYTVFTFDVRGQGESETTVDSGDAPLRQAANPQDGANFNDGTVDALRYALSRAAEFAVDPAAVGLVGHSLGASAVSIVQQCATGTTVDPLPEACTQPSRSAGALNEISTFPIKAVVAYDSLSAGVTPVVPAFDHRADGYFVNWVPSPSAPDPASRVSPGSAFATWREADVDTMTVTVRAGTHAEWSQIPYIVSATRYGVPQSKHYSLAWLDLFVKGDPGALDRLVDVTPAEAPGHHLDHRASLFSAKYASAIAVGHTEILDLRDHAGVAAIGDWVAVNAEREYGVAHERGALHAALWPAG